mmetsp:Transcript_7178/g.19690  ORF Transcript_7178/g.19690 Transcript_7178/m.19690 type:complete len:317 (+) Transcript_7178:2106-3056(+)
MPPPPLRARIPPPPRSFPSRSSARSSSPAPTRLSSPVPPRGRLPAPPRHPPRPQPSRRKTRRLRVPQRSPGRRRAPARRDTTSGRAWTTRRARPRGTRRTSPTSGWRSSGAGGASACPPWRWSTPVSASACRPCPGRRSRRRARLRTASVARLRPASTLDSARLIARRDTRLFAASARATRRTGATSPLPPSSPRTSPPSAFDAATARGPCLSAAPGSSPAPGWAGSALSTTARAATAPPARRAVCCSDAWTAPSRSAPSATGRPLSTPSRVTPSGRLSGSTCPSRSSTCAATTASSRRRLGTRRRRRGAKPRSAS